MKITAISLLIIFFLITNQVLAEPPGNGDSGENAFPISTGIIYLIAGAVMLGVRKIIGKKQQ